MQLTVRLLLALCLTVCGRAGAEPLEWIQVSKDGKGFVLASSGAPFTPWGFNYDHDGPGRLLEDYWEAEWPMVEQDFQEMKDLGANVTRIHIQFGKFMQSPTQADKGSLDRLAKLLQLAERTGIYIDLTGLGCYHKQDVPTWYDALDAPARWEAQAHFWEAVAKVCARSPAIFCYDLMNEPVVAAGKKPATDWLGPAFGGKHFVQRITLEGGGREATDIAKDWIHTLVNAIRKVDKKHLITVGLVDWSLDRPGLRSGFVPDKVTEELDFICVHLYPEKGKVDEAMETLKGFAIGKPVVIEETFPLKAGMEDFESFLKRSKEHASGWISFYWGTTVEENRKAGTLPGALIANYLEFMQRIGPEMKGGK